MNVHYSKVTNQIVNILKEYVSELAILVENEEQFWPIILKEVEENPLLLQKDAVKANINTLITSTDKKAVSTVSAKNYFCGNIICNAHCA